MKINIKRNEVEFNHTLYTVIIPKKGNDFWECIFLNHGWKKFIKISFNVVNNGIQIRNNHKKKR